MVKEERKTPIFTLRYSGVIDWGRVYAETRRYFTHTLGKPDFLEKKYKTKSDEIEGLWFFAQNVDAYNRVEFDIDFKVIDVKQLEDGKIEGKARWWVSGVLVENFDDKNPGGKREIFTDVTNAKSGEKEQSWLEKAYKRVTMRDRDEALEGIPYETIDGYLTMLRSICGAVVEDV